MSEDSFNIEEELKKLPDKPGVYIMHDKTDAIIYVGKAVSLKNRVRQYFQKRIRSPKIERMISLIHHFEYIVVGSEVEALVLECNLIKENRPKYNTMLMDDKTYPFIKVTVNEDFPRVYLTRHHVNDGSKYFGPYTSVDAARTTLDLLQKIYRFRYCRKAINVGDVNESESEAASKDKNGDGSRDNKACLYYHMHQCDGPCIGGISKEEYRKNTDKILEFLDGNSKPIVKELERKMNEASENLEFEKAIEYRNLLSNIDKMNQVQRVTGQDEGNRDVIGAAVKDGSAVVQIFFIRSGKLVGREHYYMNIENEGDSIPQGDRKEILNEFVKQFYAGVPTVPKEILISEEILEAGLIEEWLTQKAGYRISLKFPKRGEKEGLIKLACSNAAGILERDSERLKNEEKRSSGAVRELGELLGIDPPVRIEAYDISHISGFETVGSMVVYENGKPKRSDYRKFKIRTVTGPDDYASLAEVLTRRFEHGRRELEEREKADTATNENDANRTEIDMQENDREQTSSAKTGNGSQKNVLSSFAKFPDLIMMDGGRGQVNVALEVFDKLGIDQKVCGLVKDDNHRTRGIYFNNAELPIDTGSECFKFMTRVQDEVHRFAIEYHRSLRSKEQVHSILDDINGIGPARRRALMKHFASLEDIRNATVEELAACENMNSAAAVKVYEFFHEKNRSGSDNKQE